jgi:glycosyltransferase involved in cell wall biosynthesis
MPDIVIAIPTFRRPRGLARLLAAIEKLDTDRSVRVVVADNDAGKHEGFDLCQRLAPNFRFPLDALIVAQRGIAPARNALVERALADPRALFVAMLDDDEWPQPQWLSAFLEAQKATNADALQGSILFDHDDAQRSADDIRRATGVCDMLQGAGNLFLTRECLVEAGTPAFDPAFALAGGEDRDFFVRLARLGKRFAWCDEAVAHSPVPTTRMSLRWLLARAYSIGNSDMRVFLKHAPSPFALCRELAKIAGALLLSPLLLVILVAVPNRWVDALRRLCRAAGKIGALCGLYYHEYATTHGE